MYWNRRLTLAVFAGGLGLMAGASLATAGHVLDLQKLGRGTATGSCVTGALPPGCQLSVTGDTVGTQEGHGTFTLEITTGDSTSLDNANNGLCRAANRSGTQTAELVSADGSTVTFNTVGLLCQEESSGSSLQYKGAYRITGGTGRFLGAVGGGTLSATVERPSGDTFFHLHGAIR